MQRNTVFHHIHSSHLCTLTDVFYLLHHIFSHHYSKSACTVFFSELLLDSLFSPQRANATAFLLQFLFFTCSLLLSLYVTTHLHFYPYLKHLITKIQILQLHTVANHMQRNTVFHHIHSSHLCTLTDVFYLLHHIFSHHYSKSACTVFFSELLLDSLFSALV